MTHTEPTWATLSPDMLMDMAGQLVEQSKALGCRHPHALIEEAAVVIAAAQVAATKDLAWTLDNLIRGQR
jgi:hypothetical protein